MQPPKNIAKALYFIEGDPEGAECQAMVIEHEAERWLVATWLLHRATGKRYPERIVPLKALLHVEQDNGLIRLGQTLPIELLQRDAPLELLQRYGVAVFPSLVQLQTLGPTH